MEYLGHRLDAEGIHLINQDDVKQLRSYLGLINYYTKFVTRMSTVLHPLHLLLMKDHKLKWSRECDKAISSTTDATLRTHAISVHL